jgi:hypothetical protein
MDDPQLGWQDPIDQLAALRVAVEYLRAPRLGPRERFDRATFPLTKYWSMPERLKNRRDNILNARTAVWRDYGAGGAFRFDLVRIEERRALAGDIFALHEACLLDIGRMREMGGLAADYFNIVYPKDAAPLTVKPRADW